MDGLDRWLSEIGHELERSDDPAGRFVAGDLLTAMYLGGQPAAHHMARLGIVLNDPAFVREYDAMRAAPSNVTYSVRFPPRAAEWGRQFIATSLKEIRAAVCDVAKDNRYADVQKDGAGYAKAVAVSIATGVLAGVGLTGPLALGVGTLVLLTLSRATKNAFCHMTDEAVLASLDTSPADPAPAHPPSSPPPPDGPPQPPDFD